MIADELMLSGTMATLYSEGAADPDFADVLRRSGDSGDLPDLIESDGRLRLRLRRPVTLERYLDAVPDLRARPDALDAAIDMALRALARTGRGDAAAVDRLIAEHPELAAAIRDAAAINNALWSTQRIRRHLSGGCDRSLPCDFGPALEDGRPRYELRELLGEGAFGQVYLAVDRKLSEEGHPALVSIKLLAAADRSASSRRHFAEEATKARRVDHPNVVRVLDRGVSEEDENFLVYEYVAGDDLGRWVGRRRGRVPVRTAARVTAEIARGVHAAHMAGLVHCDLKPNNVVVAGDGLPKVVDFGVAVRAEERDAVGPDTGVPVGNLAFMSPEQHRMEPGALTIPTDIYALGGILFWLLTGRLPNGATPVEIERAHASRREPPALHPCGGEVDRDLEAVCRRAMAVDPADRFDSAAALADSLEAWLRREPIPWVRTPPLRRAKLWAQRKPAAALACLLLSGLVISGAAIAWHRAKLEREVAIRNRTATKLGGFIELLRQRGGEGIDHELMAMLLIGEWLLNPRFLGEEWMRLAAWEERIAAARRLIAESKARGGERAFYTMLHESMLAFWLAEEGEYVDAAPVIEGNYRKWSEILQPDDPWLTHLRAVRASVEVGLAASGEAALERFDRSEADLERARRMLHDDQWGSPLHHLVLVHLALLYGPDLLDDPERLAEVQRTLRLTEQ